MEPAINVRPIGHSKDVRSDFNYTKDVDKPTEIYFFEHEAAKNVHEPGDDVHEMKVTDGWHRVKEFSADKEGFAVHDFSTQFQNWEDDEQVREAFYPEIVEFVKKTTGAKRVLVFDHTIRTKQNQAKKLTEETNTSQRAPVRLVHCGMRAVLLLWSFAVVLGSGVRENSALSLICSHLE